MTIQFLLTLMSTVMLDLLFHEEDFMEWQEILNTIKKEHKNLVVIDFNNIICNKNSCFSSLNNVALYRDNQHLTYAGSKQIGIEYLKQHTNPFQ